MTGFHGSFHFNQSYPIQEGEVQIFLSGRIDNQDTLNKIFKSNHLAPASTDKEFVRSAFKLWGLSFASHLRGDFAAVLLDGKNKQLILARDPLGVKQLVYFLDSKKIVFASRIKYLLAEPGIPKKLNEEMMGQFFTGEFLDYESTFFEGIRQVPPAHTLIVDITGKSKMERFWSPDTKKMTRYQNKQQYLDEFYHLFEASVRSRMQGSSPAGLLLSGGLDSTQICAMAETLRRRDQRLLPLKSICLIPEGFLQEDKTAIDALIRQYQPDLEVIDHHSQGQNIFELYQEPGDSPHYDAFLTVPLLLHKLAAKGCKTLLTGYGANEYSNQMEFGYLEDLLLNFRFGKFSAECERLAACMHASGRSVKKMMILETVREKTPWWIRRIIRQKRLNKRHWLRAEFRNKIRPVPPPRLRPFGQLAQDETFHALFEPTIPINLAQMAEAAENHGLEVRHPFMDLSLIEFFLSIPVEIKMEDGYRKSFTQQALASVMPIPIRTQDHEQPFIPFKDDHNRKMFELPQIESALSNRDLLLYEYIDYDAFKTVLNPENRFMDYPLLWRLTRLSNWLESHWGK